MSDDSILGARRGKLARWRARGDAYPNDFRRTHLAEELPQLFAEQSGGDGDGNGGSDDGSGGGDGGGDGNNGNNGAVVSVAGRVMLRRGMGKAMFLTLRDSSAAMQIYTRKDSLGEESFAAAADLDLGDIVGARGELFRTRTGELTVRALEIRLLAKSLRPPPEKFHGVADSEARYRSRYLPLMSSEKERNVFLMRAKTTRFLREFFHSRGYMEAETPMLQPIPGGAAARPFVTHCGALGCDFYLRIAQELHLKRLLVGGFERVFEMNRIFRNEGVSTRHNPEFTMLEFNAAYQTCGDFMDLTEEMLHGAALAIAGAETFSYQGRPLDFSRPFARLSPMDAVLRARPEYSKAQLSERGFLLAQLQKCGADISALQNAAEEVLLFALFEECAEETLANPTFITPYPAALSPLAKPCADNPAFAERFELFAAGRELVNGFSELNDPEAQEKIFREQSKMRAGGDDEAMHYDADYIRAMEHAMPPNAGGGLGVDRLVMLLTDSPSIRDVILSPQLRPRGDAD